MIVPFESILIGVLAVVVAGLVAYMLAKWVYSKDTELEDRHLRIVKLAGELRKLGLVRIAEIFERYAVYDYDRAVQKAVDLVKALEEPGAPLRMMEPAFFAQLPERLKLDSERPRIVAIVQSVIDAEKAAKGRALAALKVQATVETPPVDPAPAPTP